MDVCATRNAQRATRNAQRATRNAQRATRNAQRATRNAQRATRNAQRATRPRAPAIRRPKCHPPTPETRAAFWEPTRPLCLARMENLSTVFCEPRTCEPANLRTENREPRTCEPANLRTANREPAKHKNKPYMRTAYHVTRTTYPVTQNATTP